MLLGWLGIRSVTGSYNLPTVHYQLREMFMSVVLFQEARTVNPNSLLEEVIAATVSGSPLEFPPYPIAATQSSRKL